MTVRTTGRTYKELFFMVDTCQANALYSKFYSPNILVTGSSEIDENSDSYLEGINKTSKATMEDFLTQSIYAVRDVRPCNDTGVRSDLFQQPLSSALVTDFFGGVADLGSSPSPRLSNTKRDPSASRPVEGTGSRLLPVGRSHADVHQTRAWAGLGMVGLLAGASFNRSSKNDIQSRSVASRSIVVLFIRHEARTLVFATVFAPHTAYGIRMTHLRDIGAVSAPVNVAGCGNTRPFPSWRYILHDVGRGRMKRSSYFNMEHNDLVVAILCTRGISCYGNVELIMILLEW
ncbi:hypothetical protein JB92DRAFT_3093771 [Gautieria morchelliformis]|nr:hypothetical protein JB92DRAFT_3093771 [Gautieria morchelliformis]